MRATASVIGRLRLVVVLGGILLCHLPASGQIQVELKIPRFQFIAYEPLMATLSVTNLAGRDIDLHDADSTPWFDFEVSGGEGQPIGPVQPITQEPLKIEAGKTVTRKINLVSLYPVHDLGTYHVRAHVYFSDLNRFFYSRARVFEVTDARPIWQKTVGIPERQAGPGSVRTYSLMTNRFPNHTSLYVRVEDKDNGIVYATYSLGHILSLDDPQAELDQQNQLHVLHCSAPRSWAYSEIGLNGQLLAHGSFMETKSRPRLNHLADGNVTVKGGMAEVPAPESAQHVAPKLSDRPAEMPK